MHPFTRPNHSAGPRLPWRLSLVAAALCAAAATHAQTFPSQPITLLIPYPPGGSADMLARPMLAMLQKEWGQPVVLDYKQARAAPSRPACWRAPNLMATPS